MMKSSASPNVVHLATLHLRFWGSKASLWNQMSSALGAFYTPYLPLTSYSLAEMQSKCSIPTEITTQPHAFRSSLTLAMSVNSFFSGCWQLIRRSVPLQKSVSAMIGLRRIGRHSKTPLILIRILASLWHAKVEKLSKRFQRPPRLCMLRIIISKLTQVQIRLEETLEIPSRLLSYEKILTWSSKRPS